MLAPVVVFSDDKKIVPVSDLKEAVFTTRVPESVALAETCGKASEGRFILRDAGAILRLTEIECKAVPLVATIVTG